MTTMAALAAGAAPPRRRPPRRAREPTGGNADPAPGANDVDDVWSRTMTKAAPAVGTNRPAKGGEVRATRMMDRGVVRREVGGGNAVTPEKTISDKEALEGE
jgi:hypothetical protein